MPGRARTFRSGRFNSSMPGLPYPSPGPGTGGLRGGGEVSTQSGGLFSGIRNWLFGRDPEIHREPSMSPEQESFFRSAMETFGQRHGQQMPYAGLLESFMQPQQMGQQYQNTLAQLMAGATPRTGEQIDARFQRDVADPAVAHFQRDIMPAVAEQYVGPGTYWGSERARGQQRAGTELAEALAGQRSEHHQFAQQLDQARQAQALQAAQAGLGHGQQAQQQALQALQAGLGWQGDAQQRAMQEMLGLLGMPTQIGYLDEGSEGAFGGILQLIGQLVPHFLD